MAENNNPNFLYSSNRESAHTHAHTHTPSLSCMAHIYRGSCFCSHAFRLGHHTINTHTFTFLLSSIYFLFQLLFGFPFLLFLFFFCVFPFSGIYCHYPKQTSERTESSDGFSKPFTLFIELLCSYPNRLTQRAFRVVCEDEDDDTNWKKHTDPPYTTKQTIWTLARACTFRKPFRGIKNK